MQTNPTTMPTTEATPQRIAIDEFAAAEALGVSVHFLRKDRRTMRRIPYYKIGSAVRYDLGRIRAALARMEEGGGEIARRSKRAA